MAELHARWRARWQGSGERFTAALTHLYRQNSVLSYKKCLCLLIHTLPSPANVEASRRNPMPGVPSQPAPASHPESAVLIAKNSKSLSTWVEGLKERGLQVYVYPSEEVPDGAVLPEVEFAYLGEGCSGHPGTTAGIPGEQAHDLPAATVPPPPPASRYPSPQLAPRPLLHLLDLMTLPPCRRLLPGYPGEDQPAQPEGHTVHGGRRQLRSEAARPQPPAPRVPRH